MIEMQEQEKFTTAQVWQYVANKIAEGLPAPIRVWVDDDTVGVYFSNHAELEEWAQTEQWAQILDDGRTVHVHGKPYPDLADPQNCDTWSTSWWTSSWRARSHAAHQAAEERHLGAAVDGVRGGLSAEDRLALRDQDRAIEGGAQ